MAVWGGHLGSGSAIEGNYPDATNQRYMEWFHFLSVSPSKCFVLLSEVSGSGSWLFVLKIQGWMLLENGL